MSSLAHAQALLREAKVRLLSAKAFVGKGYYAYAVRQSQECVELSLKAALRLAGIEYPRRHEVSGLLSKHGARYPAWFVEELPSVARISKRLEKARIPSMYGEGLGGGPPGDLFSYKSARAAIEDAGLVNSIVGRMIRGWERR